MQVSRNVVCLSDKGRCQSWPFKFLSVLPFSSSDTCGNVSGFSSKIKKASVKEVEIGLGLSVIHIVHVDWKKERYRLVFVFCVLAHSTVFIPPPGLYFHIKKLFL